MARAPQVREVDEKPPWDDPYWEGHTHTWPEPEDRTVPLTYCIECGHPWPTEDLAEHEAQVARDLAEREAPDADE